MSAMNIRKTHLAAVAACVTILATGSIALAQGDTGSSTPSAPPDYSQARALFDALNGRTGTPPADVTQALPTDKLGLDPSQAVAVPGPTGDRGETWYIVPGTGGVCLALPDGGVCGTFDQIRTNGSLWVASPAKDGTPQPKDAPESQRGWVVRGLAPSGVQTVVASATGRGETGSAEPTQNAFRLDLPSGGDTLTLQDASGGVVHEQHVGSASAG